MALRLQCTLINISCFNLNRIFFFLGKIYKTANIITSCPPQPSSGWICLYVKLEQTEIKFGTVFVVQAETSFLSGTVFE